MIRRASGGGCRRGLLVVLALVLVPLALVFYRLPQALLTWVFPNDYVYRFTVSVTLDGKTYTGETVSGCRATRSPLPDQLEDTFGSRWHARVWATPLTIRLPDNRFIAFDPLALCHEIPERRDPAWKRWLGLLPDTVAPTPPFEPFGPSYGIPILFDDVTDPRQATILLTREGAGLLGLVLSSIRLSPASWREVEDNLDRRAGAPWLAPALERCVRAWPSQCPAIDMGGYKAHRLTLTEAGQVQAFAEWQAQADRSESIRAIPNWGNPVVPMLRWKFQNKPPVAMTPDWAAGRWLLSEQTGLAHVVSRQKWPGTPAQPTFCSAAERCVTCKGGDCAVVDWIANEVIVTEYRTNMGRLVLRGEIR